MSLVQFLNDMFKLANDLFDVGVLWGGLALCVLYPLYFFFSNLKKSVKDHKGRTLLNQTIITYAMAFAAAFVWFLPEILWVGYLWYFALPMEKFNQWNEAVRWISLWRLFLILAFITIWARILGNEHGDGRWKTSSLIVCGSLLLGWIVQRWVGIFFISFPLLWAYNTLLADLALVIMPASNPEDKTERRKKIHAFYSYTWGAQSPVVVVGKHAWSKPETRVSGDITWQFFDFPVPILNKVLERPGIVWTPAHQVAAITGGTTFKRVDGPGVVFTGKLERIDQVFDLRLQLRTKEIEVVSRNGVHFFARFFTAFRLDNQVWNRDLYHNLLHRDILLRDADVPDHTAGSFPFSSKRVQATLGVTSTRFADGTPLIYWDQWVMNAVEDQTRKTISQRELDEMWRPANNIRFANALDIISDEIKTNVDPILRAAGILVFAARVVNFRFMPKENAKEGELDEISTQQIATWSSEWIRRREEVLALADAEAERAKQEARSNAEALLLNSIARGLERTNEIDPRLPRYVIARRFMSALQDYIHEQQFEGQVGDEMKERIANLQKEFKLWQERFFPGEE